MKINIKATNLELTQAIREYIEIKIGSLEHFLKRFEIKKEKEFNAENSIGKFPAGRAKNVIEVFVEIAHTTKHHRHGNILYAEATMHLGKKILRAEHSDWDIRVAIDKVKDKLQQEIIKYKELSRNFRENKK